MVCLFFNDCLPDDRPLDTYVAALQNTLNAYIDLTRKGHELCVITASHQDTLLITPDISLKICILRIPDRDKRTYALRLFSKYPIGNFYDEMAYAEKLLETPYYIEVEGKSKDATNLAIIAYFDDIIFTLGLCKELSKNQLKLHNCDDSSIDVLNLHGESLNTEFIDNILTQRQNEQKDLLTRILEHIQGEAYQSYIDHFYKIGILSQKSILSAFTTAIKENKLFPIHTDNKLLKDVTPDNAKKGRMYELRIYSPVALRVYFYQKNGKIYLVDVCGKAGNQDADIKRAYHKI